MISIVCASSLRQAKPHLHLLRTAELSSGLTRLLSSLAVLEQKDGKLLTGSLGAVTAAQKLGGSITGFLAGSNIRSASESAARVQGVEKVITIDNVAYDKVSLPCSSFHFSRLTNDPTKGLPENYAPLLVENIRKGGYTHVLAGHSAFGKNLMPRVAALLDTQQVSDITAIENEDSMFPTLLRLRPARLVALILV